jgi:hypothetical protein
MTLEAIIGMIIIMGICVGGFIYFLRIALKDKED